jgi:hypothetical protein
MTRLSPDNLQLTISGHPDGCDRTSASPPKIDILIIGAEERTLDVC